ncbi:MAG: hypothetical protein K4571_18850 [Deltaproteobacteria bacterium]
MAAKTYQTTAGGDEENPFLMKDNKSGKLVRFTVFARSGGHRSRDKSDVRQKADSSKAVHRRAGLPAEPHLF